MYLIYIPRASCKFFPLCHRAQVAMADIRPLSCLSLPSSWALQACTWDRQTLACGGSSVCTCPGLGMAVQSCAGFCCPAALVPPQCSSQPRAGSCLLLQADPSDQEQLHSKASVVGWPQPTFHTTRRSCRSSSTHFMRSFQVNPLFCMDQHFCVINFLKVAKVFLAPVTFENLEISNRGREQAGDEPRGAATALTLGKQCACPPGPLGRDTGLHRLSQRSPRAGAG